MHCRKSVHKITFFLHSPIKYFSGGHFHINLGDGRRRGKNAIVEQREGGSRNLLLLVKSRGRIALSSCLLFMSMFSRRRFFFRARNRPYFLLSFFFAGKISERPKKGENQKYKKKHKRKLNTRERAPFSSLIL